MRRSVGPRGPVGPAGGAQLGLEHARDRLVLAVHADDARLAQRRDGAHRPEDEPVVEAVARPVRGPTACGSAGGTIDSQVQLVAGHAVSRAYSGISSDLLLGLEHVRHEDVGRTVRFDQSRKWLEDLVERDDVLRLDELGEARVAHARRRRLDAPGGDARE